MASVDLNLKVEILDECGNVQWWSIPPITNLLEGSNFIITDLPIGSIKLSDIPDITGMNRCRQITTTTTTTSTTTSTTTTTTTSTSTTTTAPTTTTTGVVITTTTTALPTTTANTSSTTTSTTTIQVPQIVGIYAYETDVNQTTTVTVPNSVIGLDVLSTYTTANNGILRMKGRGTGNYQMKIRRTDGVALVLSNGQNGSLPQDTYLGSGSTGENEYTYDWTLWGVPQVEIEIKFIKNGVVDTVIITPYVVADRKILYSAAPSTTTTTTTTTSTTTAIGGNAYFINGYGEGTFGQLRNFAPFVPTQNQVWPYGNTNQIINNGIIQAGFRKGIGGILTDLRLNGGQNWINTSAAESSIFEGDLAEDTGRSGGSAYYASPHGIWIGPPTALYPNGEPTDYTGYNPVPGGSLQARDRGIILHYERKSVAGFGSDVLYIKTHPYHWSLHGVLAEAYSHVWWWLEGNTLRYYIIFEHFRTDTQMIWQGESQELIFAYLIAPLYQYFIYQGTAPKTNGALTQINKPQPVPGGGFDNANDTGNFFSTEKWIGGFKPDGNGIAIYTPYNSRFNGKQFQSWSGDERSNDSAYINAGPFAQFDINGCTAWGGYLYVGHKDNFRTWLNALPDQTIPFSWTFLPYQTRGWYSREGVAKFDENGRYYFKIGDGYNSRFKSPYNAWKGSTIPTIYVKCEIQGDMPNIRFEWTRSIEEHELNVIRIPTQGNGVQTLVLNMSGIANWTNYMVTNFVVACGYDDDSGVKHTEVFYPIYIGTVNPNS